MRRQSEGEEIMTTFNVTYSDGTEKVEVASDCDTVEQFLNSRFGTSSGRDQAKVELEGEVKAEATKPATKVKK